MNDTVIVDTPSDELFNLGGQTVAEAVRFRKLATIRVVDSIDPIEGADAIEVATIGGWKVVVKKGEFNVNDFAVYIEIDSWVPTEIAPFLSKGKDPREYNGIKGERLRTVRLRGQLSQGLLLPLNILWANDRKFAMLFSDGEDVTDYLGITKWERPENAQLAGFSRGNFPWFIRKTDAERCQNLKRGIFEAHYDEHYEASIKLDGSSITAYYLNSNDGIGADDGGPYYKVSEGVCSRNLDLKIEGNEGNAFVDAYKSTGLDVALREFGMNIAVQGELMGPGIQGNREGLTQHTIYVFNIWSIDDQKYFSPEVRAIIYEELKKLGATIKHVPLVSRISTLAELGITNMDELLAFAEGPSLNNPVREGVVFKSYDSNFMFKAISNKYLEQEK